MPTGQNQSPGRQVRTCKGSVNCSASKRATAGDFLAKRTVPLPRVTIWKWISSPVKGQEVVHGREETVRSSQEGRDAAPSDPLATSAEPQRGDAVVNLSRSCSQAIVTAPTFQIIPDRGEARDVTKDSSRSLRGTVNDDSAWTACLSIRRCNAAGCSSNDERSSTMVV